MGKGVETGTHRSDGLEPVGVDVELRYSQWRGEAGSEKRNQSSIADSGTQFARVGSGPMS